MENIKGKDHLINDEFYLNESGLNCLLFQDKIKTRNILKCRSKSFCYLLWLSVIVAEKLFLLLWHCCNKQTCITMSENTVYVIKFKNNLFQCVSFLWCEFYGTYIVVYGLLDINKVWVSCVWSKTKCYKFKKKYYSQLLHWLIKKNMYSIL